LKPIRGNRGAWLRAALHCLLAACAVILAALQFAHVATP
jgi:beta-galactosidase